MKSKTATVVNLKPEPSAPPATEIKSGSASEAEPMPDPLYEEACGFVRETRRATISHLQQRLAVGYNRAARLIEEMERAGLVGPLQPNGVREVIASPASLPAAGKSAPSKNAASAAAIQLQPLRESAKELENAYTVMRAGGAAFREKLAAVAEKTWLAPAVIRAWIAARMAESSEQADRKAEQARQLALVFEEI